MIAFILLVVGGLNWGLIALGVGDVVMMIFGSSMLTTLIYGLVGLSAIYLAATHMKDCAACKAM